MIRNYTSIWYLYPSPFSQALWNSLNHKCAIVLPLTLVNITLVKCSVKICDVYSAVICKNTVSSLRACVFTYHGSIFVSYFYQPFNNKLLASIRYTLRFVLSTYLSQLIFYPVTSWLRENPYKLLNRINLKFA